jgi:replicative DNA helicase Mcm
MDPNDRSAMHEAMEQQTVTISKANVQASLRAETSVLAAGNPKFGRFDPYQAIASQIDIQPTLLNRFDVIFILRDSPDKVKDDAIASHVLLEHKDTKARGSIDSELFRKYIAYAKKNIHPKLTDEAIEEIKKFYVTLRNAPTAADLPLRPIPITARQLEALVRLSEASAKTRLSEKVEKQDSVRAINLMKYYLMQAGYDYETKSFDIDKIVTGVTASKRGKILEVKEAIIRLESKIGKLIPVEEIEKELDGKMQRSDLDDSLDKLAMSGDIFHPKKGYIQRV